MDIEKYLAEYEMLLKKMSKCPVCFSVIDETTAKKIISQYRDEHV